MSEYAKALGAQLRSVRSASGLSLQGVEQRSSGRWKAVVVGSYERGDRAITVQRLAELAEFYEVPVASLLPDTSPSEAAAAPPRLVLDLDRLAQVPGDTGQPLERYAQTIQEQRGEHGASSLSIRAEDLRTLAVIYDLSPADLVEQLVGWGVINPDARRAVSADS
jgi:transcriptional regulator with XRE-family HTH domain